MAAFGGGLPPGISGTNDRCTVLVSNLNPDVSDVSIWVSSPFPLLKFLDAMFHCSEH